jgi:hypothetical protein
VSKKRIKARGIAREMRDWRRCLVRVAGGPNPLAWGPAQSPLGRTIWWYVPSVRVPRSLRKQAAEHGWGG